jgi:hypothetical protein
MRTNAVRQARIVKPPTSHPTPAPASVPSLKRKREDQPSLSSAPPVVLIRKAIPGTFGHQKTAPTPAPSTKNSKAATDAASNPPVRTVPRPRPTGRLVPSGLPKLSKGENDNADTAHTAQPQMNEPALESSVTTSPDIVGRNGAAEISAVATPSLDGKEAIANTPSFIPAVEPEPEPSARVRRTRAKVAAASSDGGQSDAQDSDAESSTKGRRTTRSRRPLQASDVFGPPALVSLQSKRKEPKDRSAPPDADAFWGMTAVALRALTNSHTAKNERYYATLETEIIRKEGDRPESPVMKAKTRTQRQEEEKERGRQERALRRSRRSDGSAAAVNALRATPDSLDDWDEAGDIDADDLNGVARKHRRGAGDEEDYQTPYRHNRSSEQGKAEEMDQGKAKKRVQWDRGLFTTVYLDDILPQPKKSQKEDPLKRGCLTPKAKVRLT